MSKVGIIGDKDTVMGFLALGIDIFPAYSAEEIKKTIHKLAEKEYAIIYITEEASLKAKEERATPARTKKKRIARPARGHQRSCS